MASLINLFFLLFVLWATKIILLVHGFTIDLIHRDSPQSPYYNASLSSDDRLHAALSRQSGRATFKYNFNSKVVSGGPEYLMTVFIGTPPVKIDAIVDTGSDLVWALCDPINGRKKSTMMFNRKSSRSYSLISCHTATCSSNIPNHRCGNKSACKYTFSYGDKSTTSGVLSHETFSFNISDDEEDQQTVSIPRVLFGCSNKRNGTLAKFSSLVGFGGGQLSLTSQLSRSINGKFSYCLVPPNVNVTSKLCFGDKAVVHQEGSVKTPIIKGNRPTFYFLKLEEIIVGNEKVLVAAGIDESRGGGGNIIIDSGSTFTCLDKSTFRSLAKKLSKIVKYPLMRNQDPNRRSMLCYNVSSESSKKPDLPDITFVFSGAPVKLPRTNTFWPVIKGVKYCLTIVAVSEEDGFPIFGNIAQQNLHIGYDLKEMMLSIAHADCAKLL